MRYATTETGYDTTNTETLTVTVWPVGEPDANSLALYNLDDAIPIGITAYAGTSFLTKISEIGNFPNRFAWTEPTQTFTCFDVSDNNVGDYNTGYAVWKFTAKNTACSEPVVITRADWWTGDTTPATITVSVVPITCASTCSYGMKRLNDAVCDCIDITTLPAAANLYLVSEPESPNYNKLWMNEVDEVTLRDFAWTNGILLSVTDVAALPSDCLSVVPDSTFSDEDYAQITLKAVG